MCIDPDRGGLLPPWHFIRFLLRPEESEKRECVFWSVWVFLSCCCCSFSGGLSLGFFRLQSKMCQTRFHFMLLSIHRPEESEKRE